MSRYLVLDIETVPQRRAYEALEETEQALFDRRAKRFYDEEETNKEDIYAHRGSIWAEFGQVIAVGLGILQTVPEVSLRVKCLTDKDEPVLLSSFSEILNDSRSLPMVGHNVQEFDIPFLCRRFFANHLPLPQKFVEYQHLKPWEMREKVLDTMNLWKFGDYKNFVSLSLLCHCLHLPSSKEQVSGEKVRALYLEDNMREIARYCSGDIVATARVFLRLQGLGMLSDEKVEEA